MVRSLRFARRLSALALVLLGFGASTAVAVEASAPHPFSVHDLWAMERVSDPQASPDGSRILFTLRSNDLEANRGRTDLWLVGANGEGLRRLTDDPAGDSEGRWAADGRTVYFLSSRSGSSQIWKLDAAAAAGAQAAQVTDLPLDVSAIQVSPDGSHLAFSLEVFPDCADLACTTNRLEARGKSKAHRPDLRADLRSPLGHLEGRPPQPSVRDAGRPAARRST